MNRLFIELYLDEDVDVLIADMLRTRGYVVSTAREAGQLQKSDADQLAYAAATNRTLLTHNRVDFEALAKEYLASSRHHAGIILAVRRRPAELARRLLVVLGTVTADEMADQVRYI